MFDRIVWKNLLYRSFELLWFMQEGQINDDDDDDDDDDDEKMLLLKLSWQDIRTKLSKLDI